MDFIPVWVPDPAFISTTNIARSMQELNILTLKAFHRWTVDHYEEFWKYIIGKLNIRFKRNPKKIIDLKNGVESPDWLVDAKLNIIDSCFTAPPDQIAIIYQNETGMRQTLTYAELHHLTNRIANSLLQKNLTAGDAIAIDMPMNFYAVAIYLAIIKIGAVVVPIADSFSSDEIAIRLRLTKTKMIFTQDFILRDMKKIPLYEKVIAANAPFAIVLSCKNKLELSLRDNDIDWEKFLVKNENFSAKMCDSSTHCTILFSSGTTSEPKAIPWNHSTPIKVASDAYFHQNIQADDILAWPTNLGWMMGPWLVFAALLNQATLALYDGIPNKREFGEFIQNAKVTMLGVVPTLVASWRKTRCIEGLDWNAIKLFSSTGECSNPDDMKYLMSLANNKPIIEYCGGTEIGGGYITSTVIEKNYPSLFTTPAMGIDFILLDDNEHPANNGEVALIPPSIGLSTELLNANHHDIYFAGMPTSPDGKILRRHGDQIHRLKNGTYCLLGRADDTMNLSGIKVSSAEIERVLVGIEFIIETAAVSVNVQQGRSYLVIYAATQADLSKEKIKIEMQARINQYLNPLFKIHDVVFVKELPKTASNKIMRRILRKQYQ